ncbi:LacI family DNA-binding transcriptional regulator [Amycolatopsis alkalitolerans]|uniref:LacI family transcriptional regulator n=1 Tax=Amycolatopsis alkalitolerans TaxID=2547244 RepID=A0A5C4M0T1_9PSEU|nr:LacI family DNA-binding transcriptional regulator [Amycolatopsis alkalitolerans]TNC24111.1 LacI family transcriptional regulator [Amycolatopsis alkalitolerans]
MTGRRGGRPRQADIARIAGVSQATVSLVLGGSETALALAPETRKRVMDAARELGYVADPAARRLVLRNNRLLGVYTFMATFPVDFRNSYYPFLVGVEEEAAAQGYDLLLFTGSGGEPDSTGLNRLRLADGCVLIGRHAPADELARLLDDEFPIVYLGRNDSVGTRLPYVGADYVRASADVVAELAALGHRRVYYVREPDQAVASVDREDGFRLGLRETGLRGEVIRTDGGDLGPDRLRAWLAEGATALVVEATDTQAAAGALRSAAESAGLGCPGDFSLAMLGEEVYQRPGEPVVTGFALPRREMGRRAARMLIALLSGDRAAGRQELLACTPVEGSTTAAPRAARTAEMGEL